MYSCVELVLNLLKIFHSLFTKVYKCPILDKFCRLLYYVALERNNELHIFCSISGKRFHLLNTLIKYNSKQYE